MNNIQNHFHVIFINDVISSTIHSWPWSFFYTGFAVEQWFLNYFERDPNLSFMIISRPKPQTSKKCIFNVSTLLFFQTGMK